jgi:hypothetical protein
VTEYPEISPLLRHRGVLRGTLAEHIEWAAQHGALELVASFLRGLREEDWYHVGE